MSNTKIVATIGPVTKSSSSIKALLEAGMNIARLNGAHADLDWREYVIIDKNLYRPAEVNTLCGDSNKARQELEWNPKVTFEELVAMMVDSDIEKVKKDISDSKISVFE